MVKYQLCQLSSGDLKGQHVGDPEIVVVVDFLFPWGYFQWSAIGVTLGQNKIMRECEGVGQGEELFFKLRIGNFLEPTVIDRTYSRMDEVHVGLSLQVCAFEMGDWQSWITRDFIRKVGSTPGSVTTIRGDSGITWNRLDAKRSHLPESG